MEEPSADYSQVTYKLDADGSKLKGLDVRPMAGLGYTIPGTGLDVNARYYLGMSKMAENFFYLCYNYDLRGELIYIMRKVVFIQ